MKKITLLLLISFLSIMSCDKDDPVTTISGEVTTLGTEDPIVDAKLILYGGTSNGNFSNPGADLKRIDSTYTDATGFYEFIFDASPYPVLDLVAEKEAYFSKGINQGLVRGTNVVNLVMDPFAWLKLHLKNVTPVNDFDRISIGNSFLDNTNGVFNGVVDTTIVGLVKGNSYDTKAIWFVTKNDIQNNFNEVVYCPAQDTTLFEIFY